MKAYVIKNKEGKYLDYCQDFETKNICDARLFDDYKEALSFSPKDCEVVEITIAEGDLEQELEEKELEAIRWEEHFNNAKLDYKILEQENKQLKERIAELEKENLNLGFETDFIKEKGTCAFCEYLDNEVIKELKKQLAEKDKSIRKQVCDEIRAFFDVNPEAVDFDYLNEILNQIEQAKESME